MWVIFVLLLLPSYSSAYAATTLVFPHVSVEKGCKLLHTPERWASGAALLASIPPFHIEQVCCSVFIFMFSVRFYESLNVFGGVRSIRLCILPIGSALCVL